MAATLAADYGFQPQVAKDHIAAYFRRKLVVGAFSFSDNTLTAQDGDIIDFPFYGKIGAAEKPAETASLTVDNLTDGSFQATVFEVGKAVGFTKKSLRKHKNGPSGAFQEASAQIAQVHAELLEDELIAVLENVSNHDQIYSATAAAETNVRLINAARLQGFGDRADEAAVWFVHSNNMIDFLNDTTAGFLKADANDPMYSVPGFQGRLFGMAVVMTDNMPEVAAVAAKKTYASYICKPNSYGYMEAQETEIEDDYDLLARQYVMTGNQWYAVRGFHKAIATDDVRVLRLTLASNVDA
jgi:hypothetical protein